VNTVKVWKEQRGEGEVPWVVLVGRCGGVQRLDETDALRAKWRLWWAQPEQREAARERICGG
jgi:hypothetical protein